MINLPENYLFELVSLTKEAGKILLKYYQSETKINYKSDNSPVTIADIEANKLITDFLHSFTPDIAVVSEENEEENYANTDLFWLIDPLDGTSGYIRGKPDFTVNIGLISNGYPVFGIIGSPTRNQIYVGSMGNYALRIEEDEEITPIQVANRSEQKGLRMLISSKHSSNEAASLSKEYNIKEQFPLASSFKFCVIAEGEADIYPRFGRTMEWDTAAGQAIVEAAGGKVEDMNGKRLSYNKRGFENPAFIVKGF